MERYDTIYIGYPIWWGEEPRIMDTFVESYDFGDITMIPFCTSGSSGIGNSGKNPAVPVQMPVSQPTVQVNAAVTLVCAILTS